MMQRLWSRLEELAAAVHLACRRRWLDAVARDVAECVDDDHDSEAIESEIVVRPWADADAPRLRSLLAAYLHATEALTAVVATRETVDTLLRLGLAAARRGEPCLVATLADRIVGLVLLRAIEPRPVPTLRCDVTYTVPKLRCRGIARTLRAEAFDLARSGGFAMVETTAYDDEWAFREVLDGFEITGFAMSRPVGDAVKSPRLGPQTAAPEVAPPPRAPEPVPDRVFIPGA